jgi:hypothetical protein
LAGEALRIEPRLHIDEVTGPALALNAGLVQVQSNGMFRLAGANPGKGPYNLFSRGATPSLNREYLVQITAFAELVLQPVSVTQRKIAALTRLRPELFWAVAPGARGRPLPDGRIGLDCISCDHHWSRTPRKPCRRCGSADVEAGGYRGWSYEDLDVAAEDTMAPWHYVDWATYRCGKCHHVWQVGRRAR